jgi:hypothetical protein
VLGLSGRKRSEARFEAAKGTRRCSGGVSEIEETNETREKRTQRC